MKVEPWQCGCGAVIPVGVPGTLSAWVYCPGCGAAYVWTPPTWQHTGRRESLPWPVDASMVPGAARRGDNGTSGGSR